MSKQIFINLPVKDLTKSTAFYEGLGFTSNPTFSDENASCMVWSDAIMVMLLTHEFYAQFIGNKTIIDARKQSGALLALSMDSKEAVQLFSDVAVRLGGRSHTVSMNTDNDQMFSYEVEDLDGHVWEPVWMDQSFGVDAPQV